MVQKEFENLNDSELIEADHYAETGNFSALRRMREISEGRCFSDVEFPPQIKQNPQWD